jgi:hypothetical protein
VHRHQHVDEDAELCADESVEKHGLEVLAAVIDVIEKRARVRVRKRVRKREKTPTGSRNSLRSSFVVIDQDV